MKTIITFHEEYTVDLEVTIGSKAFDITVDVIVCCDFEFPICLN